MECFLTSRHPCSCYTIPPVGLHSNLQGLELDLVEITDASQYPIVIHGTYRRCLEQIMGKVRGSSLLANSLGEFIGFISLGTLSDGEEPYTLRTRDARRG